MLYIEANFPGFVPQKVVTHKMLRCEAKALIINQLTDCGEIGVLR
jgi:hypothetical protein